MPVHVTCACGRSLHVKDEAAGKKVRCPACGAVLAVPQPEPDSDVDDKALDLLLGESDDPAPAPRTEVTASPPPRDERPRPSRAPVPPVSTRAAKATAPPKKARRSRDSEGSGFSIAVHPAIILGGLMVLGAIVWFVLGLANGVIFIYPIVLFGLGIAAMVRGFRGEE